MAIASGKLPQIFRKLLATGFTFTPDGRYVNSHGEANIREIAWAHDKIENNVAWLVVQGRKAFAYVDAANKNFARRRQAKLERELRRTKEYWLRSIRPYCDGELNNGVHWFIADCAYDDLKGAVIRAQLWNATKEGKGFEVSAEALAEWQRGEIHPPELLCRRDTLDPYTLAMIAGSLMKRPEDPSPKAAIRSAHELLVAAENYVATVPEKPETAHRLRLAFSGVSFANILRSNEKDSGMFPLLPPKQGGRQDGELSITTLRHEVTRYFDQRERERPRMTQEEYERQQRQEDALAKEGMLLRPQGGGRRKTYEEWEQEIRIAKENCLRNEQMDLINLCELRRQRFDEFLDAQAKRGLKQRGKPKPKKLQAKFSTSAGNTPH